MFHRDCYQVLSLNFRSSTETVSQEDSQIDYFATETVFVLWAGGGGGRVFPRPFTHGGFVPPIWVGRTKR